MAAEIKIQIVRVGPSTSEALIRGHRVTIDRPAAKGGSDAGPMGGELFLASIGGCFMSNLLAAINARGADLPELIGQRVQTEVTGILAESPARFTSVEISVSSDCADWELFEKLVKIAERGCIMINTLREMVSVKVQPAAVAAD